MDLFWLATFALCIHYGFTQNIGANQIRFGRPRSFPLGPAPRFSGTPFARPIPSNRRLNFIPQPLPSRRQILFPNAANSFAPAMPTTSSLLSGSVSGLNFGRVNPQGQGLVTEPSVSVDVGNLDFGAVAESVMTDMFRETMTGDNSLRNNNDLNTNSQTFSQGQPISGLPPVNSGSRLGSNVLQNNPISNNWNANLDSRPPIGSELRPVHLLNEEDSLSNRINTNNRPEIRQAPLLNGVGESTENRVNINFRAESRPNSNNMIGLNVPQTQQNTSSPVILAPAFPGFAPLQFPDLGDDSWFSYLKGLLDRTSPNLQIFSNSTGGGMYPIPQRLTDLPRGTMPIYIKNFRSNPAYVPFKLSGQPFNLLIPFNRDNREMMYPYLPLYIPYPNVGIDVPEIGMRFVAYLPFQPDRYRTSREGAGVIIPQLSAPGSFPIYVDRRPVLGNLMQRMG
ncbi:uncharacterized protein LOC133190180 [Saccostrea echinata]|uniref:uncharacterized protein LOC133190180 n=1 Tax=Saccostrea echinata TaxID=191078 RepID=UPI002A7F0488|nr:uncharacterized protein LOC133190180 [Saccostrea echinata]